MSQQGSVVRLSRCYRCPNESCGELHEGWRARCTKCRSHNLVRVEPGDRVSTTSDDTLIDEDPSDDGVDELANVTSVAMSWNEIDSEEHQFMPTGIAPFDAVLGGGIVPGGMYALGGLPGSGKCLGRGTPVMKVDGSVVPVESIVEGDMLMGPDGSGRRVHSVTRGTGNLFRIEPTKGDPWICNDVHMMTIVCSGTDEIIDIPLDQLLASSGGFRHHAKLFTVGIESFSGFTGALPVDPYFLGMWFGDGTKALSYSVAQSGEILHGVQITKPDKEIRDACDEVAAQWGLTVVTRDADRCPSHSIVGRKGAVNPLLEAMRDLVGPAVTMPESYIRAPRTQRLRFLAGLLDTDGDLERNCFYIIPKRKDWADAIWWMARSLGFYSSISPKKGRCPRSDGTMFEGDYWRVAISGDLDLIPTRIPRRQATPRQQKKIATRTGFRAHPIGSGEFFGFTLEGDGRFLLGDFTVTHNTSLLMQALDGTGERVLFATGEQTVGDVKNNGKRIGVGGARITVVHEPMLPGVLAHARKLKPAILAVDSIQTLVDPTVNGKPGSPAQVTECTRQLMNFAKSSGVAVCLICHVTNDGTMAGPQTLKHLVDAVFDLEPVTDVVRVLRTLIKNRYGNSATKGRFVMTDHGLEPEPEYDAESDDDTAALAALGQRVTEAACQYVDSDMESIGPLVDAVRDYQRIYKKRQR